MFLWLKLVAGPPGDLLPDGSYDATKATLETLLPNGVIVVPGQPFFPEGGVKCGYIRVSYSMATEETLEKGFRRMAELLRARIGDGEV